MADLEKDGVVSIYSQIAANFRRQILSGELEAGARLPTELELAELHQISRGTVRQAMNLLVTEGLLERVAGKGTFVSRLHAIEKPQGEIGLVVPYARDALIMDILLGVENAAKSRGYSLMFSFTGEDLDQESQDIQRMRRDGVKGLILFPLSNIQYDPAVWQLHAEGFPLVLIDRYFIDLPCDYVVVDNLGGAYYAAEHLINLGHRAVGFVCTSGMQTTSVQDRYQGYRRALADHNLPFQESWLCSASLARSDENEEVAFFRKYLSSKDHPKAFFAVNDYAAIRFARAAQAEGLSLPEDIALVGFDDIQQASQLPVPLTTMAQPRYELGTRSALSLLDRLQGHRSRVSRIVLPTTLVVRQSCGARQHLIP